MKLTCQCGCIIPDSGANHPHKAHLIPDEDLLGFLDLIDDCIEKRDSILKSKDSLCMRIRSRFHQISRIVYQCPDCSRLYISDTDHNLHEFAASVSESPRDLLASKTRKK